ncbi:MAG: catalase/peroxidase HPI [Myxococcota bacterium]
MRHILGFTLRRKAVHRVKTKKQHRSRVTSPETATRALLVFVSLSTGGCASTNDGLEKKNIPPEQAATTASGKKRPYTIEDWWPNRLDLRALRANAPAGDPTDEDFDYASSFGELDLNAVKKDIADVLTNSQEWWPADWGNYGGLMIRLAWHSAGTYRAIDGRGGAASGAIRFAPLNSWPDNANLDKARRLLWPVKKKYGRSLSWADLMVLSGNVAFETMGLKTFGFGGGRVDVYEPMDINWGPETEWLADERFSKDGKVLEPPLGATQMGLIYVNPEGPQGNPDPLLAAEHIRITFGRMGMNDEETVALIAGGHTLGKAHGAAPAGPYVGAEPERAAVEEQGFGWKNTYGTGKGKDTITSGLEGAWTQSPTQWSQGYFQNLFGNEWELITGPGGAKQWSPKSGAASVPDAHVTGKMQKPMMLTTDLAMRFDPAYAKISRRFLEHPEEFNQAFAKAWYKLTHRDMGPQSRLVGAEVAPAQLWQDPVPPVEHPLVTGVELAELKKLLLASGLSGSQLVKAAWSSASSYRDTDKRGGANGARVRLTPQRDWATNEPTELKATLAKLEAVQKQFNGSRNDGKRISLADLIVFGGNVAIEEAAAKSGYKVEVPFVPGRTDATQEQTDANTFAFLEPASDGFRNYIGGLGPQQATEQLVERADMLTLTAPEMTVLVGGLRALGATHPGTIDGFMTRPGALSHEFFIALLDMDVEWSRSSTDPTLYEGKSRKTGATLRRGTAIDLVFGSHAQLRALAEVYAADDAGEKFVTDFIAAWTKVMNLDRFDLRMSATATSAARPPVTKG